MTDRIGKSARRIVAERARGLCEYCRCPDTLNGRSFGGTSHSVDHIVPASRGGGSSPDNLALACQGCNGRKYIWTEAVDPESGERVPLFHPRSQRWSDHFEWSPDFLRVAGKTATGRATLAFLKLNREGVVELRRALRRLGEHPLPGPGD